MGTGGAGTFGTLLRRYRQAAALSQEALAERAALSAVAVSALERGVRRAPHLATVEVLATALALGAADRAALVAAARPERAAPSIANDPVRLAGRELALPTGMLVFLIADLRGYTAFTHQHGDEAGARLATRFAELAGEAVQAEGGRGMEPRGDEVLAVFGSARAALRAAVDLLARCAAAATPELPLRAGVGVEAGEAVAVAGAYFGEAVNVAARLCAQAGPGEALASATVVGLARHVEGLAYEERGELALKGLPRPVRTWLVRAGTAVLEGETSEVAVGPPLIPARPYRATRFAADVLVPLVGRGQELTLLDRFLAGTREPLGQAPVLLLAGEPGIGKTRLLQAAAQLAVPRGWCVLAGGCQRRGGQEPYAPLLEAMTQHLQALGPAQLRTALAGCAWLVRLLPELAEVLKPLPAASLAPEQERRLIHAAVARLLANVAGPAGTLLILDDLHWSGQDALDLIATLVRAAPVPLRLLGAYRDTEVRAADPLGLLLADLAQARLARQHTLGPLDATEAASLLQALLAEAPAGEVGWAEEVLQRAGGVPFFLVSYAQALHQGGAEGVPWDLAQGVRQRLALLPEAAQVVLGAVAVIGRRAARALLVAATAQPEEAVLVGLEAACGARLLREDGDDAYAFVHDVIREVVEAELGAARRVLLHRRVAEALEGGPGGASPALLAYHYARGGVPDKAALYLEQAGDHAWSQRAHIAAEGHYREALDRLEGLGRKQDAARVREQLGEVLYWVGRFDATLGVLEQAAEVYRVAGDLEGLVRATAAIGRAHAMRGTPHEGLAVLTALLERLERDGASPPLQTLYEALSWPLFTAGQYEAALAACEQAAAAAHAAGDKRTAMMADQQRVNLLQLLGRFGEALQVGGGVLALAEELADVGRVAQLACGLAYIHALQGAFGTSRRLFDRAVAAAAQMENPSRLSFSLAHRAWLAALAGDGQGAHADLDRALASSRQADRTWYSAYPLIFLARLSLAEGDFAGATASVREALALLQGGDDLQALRWAATTMAEIDVLEGRAELARERLVPLLDRPGLEECDVTTLLPALAWAYLEVGQVDLAAEAVEQALARARCEEMRLVLVEALRVQALIAMCREQRDEAMRSLEEGLALARAMPYPYAEARLLHLDGLLHVQQGEADAARERLEAARATFARLGARMEIERLEQAFTALSQKQSAV